MSEHTPLGTESTMDLDTATRYLSASSQSESEIGETITEEMMDSYDGLDAGKSIRQTFLSCDTEEEWHLADRMFSALTGFTLHEITATTNSKPYSLFTPCGWHNEKNESFQNVEERKDFYFKDRDRDEISELGAAALMAGGIEDADGVGYAYLEVFRSAATDRQAQICDAVSIAVTGFSFDTILDVCGIAHERPDPAKKQTHAKSR